MPRSIYGAPRGMRGAFSLEASCETLTTPLGRSQGLCTEGTRTPLALGFLAAGGFRPSSSRSGAGEMERLTVQAAP